VQLYRKQVVKQADLVLAMHWCSEAFTAEQKARNVDYYERRTVRDSSLSACTQAVMCAEVGHLHLAHRYATEAALVDLRDLHQNSRDGLHMASLAGAWLALVAGFGGMRQSGERLALDPALPDGITRLAFRMRWRRSLLHADVRHGTVTLTVTGAPLTLLLAGAELEVHEGAPVERPLAPRRALLPEPPQPPGRAPAEMTQR
jgi:alpha,alpha-trehalose phosphorylase